MMAPMKRLFPLVLLPLLLAGCGTMNNLTPTQQKRSATGLYPFEVEWVSRQQSLRPESIKAYVVIDFDYYPMQLTPMLPHRWETLVPIAADKKNVNFRYKFDYEYNAIPVPANDSTLSPPYQLHIVN